MPFLKQAGRLDKILETIQKYPEIATTPLGAVIGAGLHRVLSEPEERSTEGYVKGALGGGAVGLGVGGILDYVNRPAKKGPASEAQAATEENIRKGSEIKKSKPKAGDKSHVEQYLGDTVNQDLQSFKEKSNGKTMLKDMSVGSGYGAGVGAVTAPVAQQVVDIVRLAKSRGIPIRTALKAMSWKSIVNPGAKALADRAMKGSIIGSATGAVAGPVTFDGISIADDAHTAAKKTLSFLTNSTGLTSDSKYDALTTTGLNPLTAPKSPMDVARVAQGQKPLNLKVPELYSEKDVEGVGTSWLSQLIRAKLGLGQVGALEDQMSELTSAKGSPAIPYQKVKHN